MSAFPFNPPIDRPALSKAMTEMEKPFRRIQTGKWIDLFGEPLGVVHTEIAVEIYNGYKVSKAWFEPRKPETFTVRVDLRTLTLAERKRLYALRIIPRALYNVLNEKFCPKDRNASIRPLRLFADEDLELMKGYDPHGRWRSRFEPQPGFEQAAPTEWDEYLEALRIATLMAWYAGKAQDEIYERARESAHAKAERLRDMALAGPRSRISGQA